jgi:glycosyltransferase involved in cell wall biosynthesis
VSAQPPFLSVLMPVYDGAETLDAALAALRASRFHDYELIVVDDGSRDQSPAIAQRWKPDVFARHDTNRGHMAARNRGAALARGRVLVSIDADVCVAPDTLERIAAHFADPAFECVVGLYEPRQPHGGAVSAYKNAWIHHSYAESPDRIDWFFTAVGAVRRDVFEREGGFVDRFRRESGGGDVEFGRRLHAAGVRIHLDKALRVTHLRRFTLASLLRNDYRRAAGWTRLALGSRAGLRTAVRRGVANVRRGFALSAALTFAACLVPLLSARAGLLALALAFALQLALDRRFLSFACALFGPGRCVAFACLGFLDRVACGAGLVAGALAAVRAGLPAVGARPLASVDDR